VNDTRSLSSRLAELLRREHHALADFLVALSDFDRERRWLELGYTSCFYFLHRELGLSKGAAFYRKTAAELIQRFPEVVEPLRDGRLCLTSVVELSKVITPENRDEVVERFFHASKQEAKAVAAELRPAQAPPHRDVVTVLKAPSGVAVACETATSTRQEPTLDGLIRGQSVHPDEPRDVPDSTASVEPPSTAIAQPTPDQVEPLTGELRRFHVTVSKRFLEKLASARDALSHGRPRASTEEVLEAALDLLLAKKAQQRGIVKRPRAAQARTSDRPRHVPAEVKRAIWARDGGRCQWPVSSGGICGSTRRLELDHIVPVARGGTSTVDNLRITCRCHNQLAAREAFGDAWMDRFASKTGPQRPSGSDVRESRAPAR
jgi:5-methylcytosine-specific restriction endonuclease McrA